MKRILLLCLTLGLFAGCGKGTTSPSGEAPAKPKYMVIFSQCNHAEPYRAAQNGLLKELLDKDPEVKLAVYDGQADAAKQISQIENAIRQKPDLLIVAPLQRDALTKVMGEAMAAGIPTICLERDIIEPNYTTYIRCDNRKIGQMAGPYIVDYLTKKNGSPKVDEKGNPLYRGIKKISSVFCKHMVEKTPEKVGV